MRRLAAVILVALLPACAVRTNGPPADAPVRPSGDAGEPFIDSLLARMTLDEKLGQLTQLAASDYASTPDTLAALIRRGAVGSLMEVIGGDTATTLQRLAVERSRLRIPLLFADDVIHGFRSIFPIPLAEAASWDARLATATARFAASEAAADGIAWTYAPMVDVARDPRWGRIMEGAGEDPFLGAVFAAARVRGFQGDDLRLPGAIAATAKHFAAYGAAEGGRDYAAADVSPRTLREVYLPPFRAAVCAGAATVMASFNETGGVPSHANRQLLTDLLRGEWGFDGLVVSDWNGVVELIPHGVAADGAAAGALALHAGVDVDMVSQVYARELPALVRAGRVPIAEVDDAVRRVLRLKLRLGLFNAPYARGGSGTAGDLAARRDSLLLEAARESIVLLENRGNLLPLESDAGPLAVIGALAADSLSPLGSWAERAAPNRAVTVLDGIRRAVSPGTRVVYARGASPASDDTSGIAEAVRVARAAKVAVLVLGETREMSGEASSRASLGLPGAQLRLAQAVHATGVPVVVVLMNGRPLAIPWLSAHVPAIVEAWFGGSRAGIAVADVLFGRYDPGGKLPATVPRSVGQVPIYAAHDRTGRPPSADNRYTSKYTDEPWTPLYPFGYGLSYTAFTLSVPRLSTTVVRPGDTLRVEVDVTNTGAVAGADVVQLYVRDDVASVARPVQELRAFRRVELAPGERRTVRFTLDDQALAFHDTSMTRVVEPGTFTVLTGDDAVRTTEARFRLVTGEGKSVRVPDRCPDR